MWADAEEARVPEDEIGELAGLDRADLGVETVRDGRADRVLRDVAARLARCPGQAALPAGPSRAFIACAVCQVRMIVSPARPIACESEPIIEIAPRSCSTSSAAIVDARMRLSANARSSGTRGFRWWQTMSMSRCSASVLTVCGRVGLVDDGRTFGNEAIRMMSGAWPPPAPSVWYAWIERPAIASTVDSRKPVSLSVSVWIATWTPVSSATRRQASIAGRRRPPVLVELEPARAAPHLLVERLGGNGVALAEEQHVDRALVQRAEHRGECVLTGRARRRLRALRRARAAADQGRDPRGEGLVVGLSLLVPSGFNNVPSPASVCHRKLVCTHHIQDFSSPHKAASGYVHSTVRCWFSIEWLIESSYSQKSFQSCFSSHALSPVTLTPA